MVSGATTKANANFILFFVKFQVISLRTGHLDPPIRRSFLRLDLGKDKDWLDLELIRRQFSTFLVVEMIVDTSDGLVSLATAKTNEFVIVPGVVASEVFLCSSLGSLSWVPLFPCHQNHILCDLNDNECHV